MDMNDKKMDPKCPIVDIDGFIADGKQFDLDITLANDHRNVIYGVVKDCFKEPVEDAVVKLVEVDFKFVKKEFKPVSHTFTDEEGEFVFGPLCPDKKYAIQIWKDSVKHIKICFKSRHEGKCLKGVEIDCEHHDDFKPCDKHERPEKPYDRSECTEEDCAEE